VNVPASGFLRWRSWGQAERRVLLLHDAGSSSATWWRVGPALAEAGWRVKAPDLPSHGASARADRALTPEVAATWIVRELAGRPVDLVVGHCFGAAVALSLAGSGVRIGCLVLDELPSRHSVDWAAEADRLLTRSEAARRDPDSMIQRWLVEEPHWAEEDYRTAVRDMARMAAPEVAEGLRRGPRWPTLANIQPDCPTLMLSAPPALGVSELVGAGALRGEERATAQLVADAFVELGGGHCLHRDDPDGWVRAVTGFAG
jgi:pimeloyl-ACP methyl ester carboxylesterase